VAEIYNTGGASAEPRPVMYVVEDQLLLQAEFETVANQLGLELRFYSSVRKFLGLGEHVHPCCLVLEMRVGEESGEDLQVELIQRGLTFPIIFNTRFADVESAVRVMERGAITVLQKPTSTSRLTQYVRAAIELDKNQSYFDCMHRDVETFLGDLTERQRYILDCVVEGMPTKLIARQLDVSTRLVEKERSQILKTFEVESTPGVTLRIGQFLILDQIHQRSVPRPKLRPAAQRGTGNPQPEREN